MNVRCCFLLSLALLVATPAFAAKSAKAATPSPSVQLRGIIDKTMAQLGTISNEKQPPFNRTALSSAQGDYAAKALTAPPAQQPMYQAAQNVVANLVGAVEEHEKAVADFRYSKNLHGAQDREDEDISNARQHSGTAFANNQKQNKENADSRKALLDKEKFLSNGSVIAWTTRVGQLHDIVEQSYLVEVVAEKQYAMLTPPALPPHPAPKPTYKPEETSAAEQYSPVGAWRSVIPHYRSVTLKDDNTIAGGVPDGKKFGGTWKWTNQSEGALIIAWSDGLKENVSLSADGHTMAGKSSNGHDASLTRDDNPLPPPASAGQPAPRAKGAPKSKDPSASQLSSPIGAWKPLQAGHRAPTLNADNTVVFGKRTGTWKWTDQSKGALNIAWSDGLSEDLNLSPDGRTLSGIASNGHDENLIRDTATTPAGPSGQPPPEQNSPVGTWTPTKSAHRPVTFMDDNTANIGVPGKKHGGTWKWTDKSKGALHVAWSDGLTMELNVSADGRTLSGTESNGQAESYTRSTGAEPTASTASTAHAPPPAIAEIRLSADTSKGLSLQQDKAVAISPTHASKIRFQPGLKDPSLVSLQLAGVKSFYLRHQRGILYLHERPQLNTLFEADASFKLVYLDGDKVRFESSNFPGTFITAKDDGSVVVIRDPSPAQSTFILKAD